MREQGLAARVKKKRRSTTRPGKGRWRAPAHLLRLMHHRAADPLHQVEAVDAAHRTAAVGFLLHARSIARRISMLSHRPAIVILLIHRPSLFPSPRGRDRSSLCCQAFIPRSNQPDPDLTLSNGSDRVARAAQNGPRD